MPITQSRMIALAKAGRDFQQAYEQTWKSIEEYSQAVQNGRLTAQEAILALSLYNGPRLRISDLNSPAVIAVELAHFKSFQGRNNAAARSARKRRAQLAAAAVSTTFPADSPATADSLPEIKLHNLPDPDPKPEEDLFTTESSIELTPDEIEEIKSRLSPESRKQIDQTLSRAEKSEG